jgi:ubiquinone/menaquinone biosynthesis C-methylase UbiE
MHLSRDMKERPQSIENRWDILYRDYPEVYDEFANVPYEPRMVDVLHKEFNLDGKTIADIGSGSGRSSIQLAKYAERVIGVEPEKAMRDEAEKNTAGTGLDNITYIDGRAEEIPLDDGSFDMVVALTASMYPPEEVIPLFVEEAKRVVKTGGVIVSVDVAQGWYGGELADVIDDPGADLDLRAKHRCFEVAGFSYFDVRQTSFYGSLEKIIGTYGFIFGVKVIDYIKQNNITSIKWTFRVYHYNC